MVRSIAMVIAMAQVASTSPKWNNINQISENLKIGTDDWIIELSGKVGSINKRGYSIKVFSGSENRFIVVWYVGEKMFHAMYRKEVRWVSLKKLNQLNESMNLIRFKNENYKLCGGGSFGLLHEKPHSPEDGGR